MGLRDAILHEPVSSLPLRKALTIQPQASVRQALDLMRQDKLGCVFLLSGSGRPTRMFTERVMIKLLASEPDRLDDPVEQHAIDIACLVKLNDPISLVLKQMQQSNIRFVCVVDEKDRLVGLTGQRGLMEYLAEHFPRAVKVHVLESKLYMDQREGA
ncbi:MAG: CBS domain-containing protein [Phycisphaeraceae bacterium]|nr:CBS domain-containing protein [Phycisphaeraceae bacterium]